MKKVAIVSAPNYAAEELRAALREGLNLLLPQGLEGIIRPNDTVAIKVNMLMGKTPERAITTHPSVVREVCLLVKECGGKALIIDSPGGPYTPGALKRAYEKCGFAAVAAETGAELNFDISTVKVHDHRHPEYGTAMLLSPAINADLIINLPKLKTHGLTVLTCATKNMFGLVPGLTKIDYHLRYPEITDFCRALVHIAELAQPELTIVDAVEAMEGEGPSSGTPRHCGALLLGHDLHALDVYAARLMGIDPLTVPTIEAAQALGLLSATLAEVALVGSMPIVAPFVVPDVGRRPNIFRRLGNSPLARQLARHLKPRLIFESGKCISCGICVESCPPQALRLAPKSLPQVDMAKCISCFCCQELCPEHAVIVQKSWLSRVIR